MNGKPREHNNFVKEFLALLCSLINGILWGVQGKVIWHMFNS